MRGTTESHGVSDSALESCRVNGKAVAPNHHSRCTRHCEMRSIGRSKQPSRLPRPRSTTHNTHIILTLATLQNPGLPKQTEIRRSHLPDLTPHHTTPDRASQNCPNVHQSNVLLALPRRLPDDDPRVRPVPTLPQPARLPECLRLWQGQHGEGPSHLSELRCPGAGMDLLGRGCRGGEWGFLWCLRGVYGDEGGGGGAFVVRPWG